jgi:PEGA domain
MGIIRHMRTNVCRSAARLVLVSVVLLVAAFSGRAQAVAETAGTTTTAGTVASSSKQLGFASTNSPKDKNASPHLAATSGPPPEVVNRQALEQQAGSDAGKIMLRSVPTGAQIWINDMFVGNAPMLLIVAPGKYKIDARGPRSEHMESSVDLLPHETRKVVLTLTARYPMRVSVR